MGDVDLTGIQVVLRGTGGLTTASCCIARQRRREPNAVRHAPADAPLCVRPDSHMTSNPMLRSLFVLVFAASLLTSTAAEAVVPPATAEESSPRVWMSFGWESTWELRIGYARGLPALVDSHDAVFDLSLRVPLALVSRLDGLGLDAGLAVQLTSESGMGVSLGGSTGLVWADDSTGSKLGWTGGLTAAPGYYGDSWGVGLDMEWLFSFGTYMWHSEVVTDTFDDRYPGASDGPNRSWYWFPAHRFRLGLSSETYSNRLFGFGSFGLEYTPQKQGIFGHPALGQLPFYVRLGGGMQW